MDRECAPGGVLSSNTPKQGTESKQFGTVIMNFTDMRMKCLEIAKESGATGNELLALTLSMYAFVCNEDCSFNGRLSRRGGDTNAEPK